MQGMLNALAPVDTARARQRGTQNALSEMKARRSANTLNQQQAMREASRQGGTTDQTANILKDKGYAQAANKLHQQQMQTESADLEKRVNESQYVAQRAREIGDESSYQDFKRELKELRPDRAQFIDSLPDQYGPQARQALDQLAMKTEEKIKQTISGEQANQLFGTELAPGSAVTVEGGRGNMSISDVQEAAGGDSTQTEREIQRYIERGYSRDVAEDIAYGNIDVETDQFGNTYLVNKATGDRRVLRGQGQEGEGSQQDQSQDQSQKDPIKPQDQREQSLFKAVDETGPWAWLRSAGNNVIGPFLEGVPFEETAASKQQLRQFNYAVQQAFKQDDGRMSNYERQIIREFLPDPDRIMTDPDKERTKLREMRTFLERQKEQLQQSMEEKVTAQERGKLSNQIETVDRVLNLMGSPGQGESQYTRDNPAQPTTQEEYDRLPSGAYFRDDEGLKRKP